ncbi:MAG: PQQ-binding-like beta-propeller repeat protein [Pirellulales bacterium]|nr:PQQ-binding-like beta-propeller repeat protein [Pirellulales bacterium]
MNRDRVLIVGLLVLGLAPPANAELPWPRRNGPFENGCAAPSDARGVPTEWDEATGKNIAWKVDLEGFGHSTPVIGNGRLWLTAATKDGKQQFVYAIDTQIGQVIHHKLLFENAAPEPLGNEVNTYASPTCVLEEDAVYVHFGSYGTARLDPKTAEVVWQRRDLPCRHFRGPGSSPYVWHDLLILTFDGIDQQYVTALDKRTGKTIWRTDRSTDYHDLDANGKAKLDGDLRKAYGTPGTIDVAGTTQLVSIGSRAAFGYEAATGREIWTVTHEDFNAAAPPLFFENLAIMNTGSGGAKFMAVRLDDSTRGNVDSTHIVWNRTRGNSRLSGPALDRDRIWMLTDNGVLYGLSAKTGEELAVLRLGGSYVASPVVVGDHLYACNEDGTTTVVRTTVPPEILARNVLDEGMRASPAVAAGAIYLRTFTRLYKIATAYAK